MGRKRPKDGLTDTERQLLFAKHYLVHFVGSKAAIEAGYSPATAPATASRLLTYVNVQNAIAEGMRAKLEALDPELDAVIARLWAVATVDRTEITKRHVGCCRYCWGHNHDYQWKTEREYREAVDRWRLLPPKAQEMNERPTDDGGYGYRVTTKANPECPECAGLGVPYTVFVDTDDLTPEARMVFEGVKETQQGIEYKLSDRMKALELIGKHLGLADKAQEDTSNRLIDTLREISSRGSAMPIPEGATSPNPLAQVPGDQDDEDEEDDEVEP